MALHTQHILHGTPTVTTWHSTTIYRKCLLSTYYMVFHAPSHIRNMRTMNRNNNYNNNKA